MRRTPCLLLLALTACGLPPDTTPGITGPLSVYCEPDVDTADCEAMLDAAASWGAAMGRTVAVAGDYAAGGCGVYIERGEFILEKEGKWGGWTRGKGPCQLHTSLRPDISDALRKAAAIHEMGHALMHANDSDHSDDPSSVMYYKISIKKPQSITDNDIERVTERMNGE